MAGIDPHIYFSAVAAVTVAADIKPLKVEGFASETVELLITGTATVTFEGAGQLEKSDGTYYAIPATNLTTGATSTTATASGLYRVDVRGFNWFRPRVSTYSSGAVSAAGNATMVGGGAGRAGGGGSSGGAAGGTTSTATIANAGTTSGSIDARGYTAFGLVIPATFTGTSISFLVSADNSTFQALYDITGALVSVPVTQGRSYDAPGELTEWPYWEIVSNAAEGGARSIVVVAKG